MKKTRIIAKIAAIMLALATLLTFTSCAKVLEFVSDLSIKKQEVTDGSCWRYEGVQSYEYVSAEGENDAYSARLFASSYNSKYAINIWETTAQNTISAVGLYDYIECKNGELIRHHFDGIGDASFMNGASVYDKCEEQKDVIGTYSGKDVTINGEKNTTLEHAVKAYASEDKLIIRIEEEFESGAKFKAEFAFTLMDEADLDRYNRGYILAAAE